VENVFRVMAARRDGGAPSADLVREATSEVARPVAFAVGSILLVYVPVLLLGGVEGKMFRPMALTVIFALSGSLVFALTLVPVLASLFMKPGVHHDPWVGRASDRINERFAQASRRRPNLVI
jgi:cobalt-zinc-cadmium resistance protein CzcA